MLRDNQPDNQRDYRDYRLQVKLNSYERQKLSEYAATVSLTLSEAIRELIRQLPDCPIKRLT